MHACVGPHLHLWTTIVSTYANYKQERRDGLGFQGCWWRWCSEGRVVIPGEHMQAFKLGWVWALALEPTKVSAMFDSDTSPSCSSFPCSPAGAEEEMGEASSGVGAVGVVRREEHCAPRVYACVCAPEGIDGVQAGLTEDPYISSSKWEIQTQQKMPEITAGVPARV